jgi:hypothetical protein
MLLSRDANATVKQRLGRPVVPNLISELVGGNAELNVFMPLQPKIPGWAALARLRRRHTPVAAGNQG